MLLLLNGRRLLLKLAGLFLLALLLPVTAQAADVHDWLERMSRAQKEQNYRGVLIYGNHQRWETLQLAHAVRQGVEYERLLHLTGAPREVIRQGHDVTCIHPGEHMMRFNVQANPLKRDFAYQHAAPDAYYGFTLGQQNRVAGRLAQRIDVTPKDGYRYGYQLWLDRDSGLLLRSDLVDARQQVLERFQFAAIEIGVALADSDFQPQSQGHRLAAHMASHESTDVLEQQRWQIGWLPRGFMVAASQVRAQNGNALNHPAADSGQGTLATLMYTDGLAAITVFVDDASGEPPMPLMKQRWGATAAVVSYLNTDERQYRISVVGEVPLLTLEKIATSVMPQ